ncbi:retropepsin-like aspartic protease family protein [Shimia marina]|uniref:Clan AA aspartic protease n=1 Tax=Shimia marina TaxID=321267 RepID=A0A0P1EU69_9RHOB|nr:TIGR02281 family clan AA aspartic protease [Shimia marina]CUH53614.1 clan AA aspartic protease [Shimia marina]SFD72857.1 aspartyl protease family protein [Shimia marina]
MSEFDVGHLIYMALLLIMVLIWFLSSGRINLGQTLRHAAIWALIFLGAIALVGLWEDIQHSVRPMQSVLAEDGRIEIPRNADGHFYANLDINGASIRFVVDTGATDLVLTQADARRAGLDPDNLPYFGRAMTANGEVRTAPVWLEDVSFSGIEDHDVRASVNEGEMSQSLLGMSYLERFEQITIAGNRLILIR